VGTVGDVRAGRRTAKGMDDARGVQRHTQVLARVAAQGQASSGGAGAGAGGGVGGGGMAFSVRVRERGEKQRRRRDPTVLKNVIFGG
jgi:hypothetical protein